MRKPFLIGMLAGIGLLCVAATFGPVVFRSWVLQHDLDGGGHTISNVAIDATSLLLDGAAVGGGGGDTVWTNDVNVLKNVDQAKNTAYIDNDNGWVVIAAEPSTLTPTFTSGKIEVVAIGDLFRLGGTAQLIDGQGGTYDVVMIGDGPFASATNVFQSVGIGNGPMDLAPSVENSVGIGFGGSELGPIHNCTFLGAAANGGTTTNSITNRVAIGYNASCTNDNTIVLGDSNVTSVKSAGTFTSTAGFAKGSFTGITTTNTFFSVDAGLTSTVTNVVVVQGGLIVAWTVTP